MPNLESSIVLDVLVIGAGQAGLATAYHLQRQGLNFLVLEAAKRPVGSWPLHYRSLKLFSPAKYSSLPAVPFPGDPERYPTRDEVVAYLTTYAAHFQFPIHMQKDVVKVEKQGDFFQTHASDGQTYLSKAVIAAAGTFRKPFLPSILGQEEFKGRTLHSLHYSVPTPFAGQRVVVVGAGNSAVQIAVELAEVAQVTLATRQGVKFMPQCVLGRDVHDWLTWLRVDQLPLGWLGRVPDTSRVNDNGRYRAALRQGKPDQRRMFTAFTTDGVRWADGRQEQVDAVIFATGYRANLDFLSIPGALDARLEPVQKAGISQNVSGLYFVGLSGQRAFGSATLRGATLDAQVVVRHLIRHLRPEPLAHSNRRLALRFPVNCC